MGARLCGCLYIAIDMFPYPRDPFSLCTPSSQSFEVQRPHIGPVFFPTPSHSPEASGLMENQNQERQGKAGAGLYKFGLCVTVGNSLCVHLGCAEGESDPAH